MSLSHSSNLKNGYTLHFWENVERVLGLRFSTTQGHDRETLREAIRETWKVGDWKQKRQIDVLMEAAGR